MVATDKFAFKAAFNRLAVATRLPADQADAASQRIYFEGLQDIPIDAVVSAAQRLEQAAQWFPKVVEWRREARETQRVETRLQLPGTVQAEPSIEPRHLQEAVYDYLAMRSAGVPREQATKGFEDMLRAFLVPGRATPWRSECEACDDSGWEIRTCYTDQGPACGVSACRRTSEHSYAVACSCRETNRTYQRNRARGW